MKFKDDWMTILKSLNFLIISQNTCVLFLVRVGSWKTKTIDIVTILLVTMQGNTSLPFFWKQCKDVHCKHFSGTNVCKFNIIIVMPKHWGKQFVPHGRFPEVDQKQKTEKEKKKKKKRPKVANNNGQLCIATPPRVVHAKLPGPIELQL